jgi:hypothetical protein
MLCLCELCLYVVFVWTVFICCVCVDCVYMLCLCGLYIYVVFVWTVFICCVCVDCIFMLCLCGLCLFVVLVWTVFTTKSHVKFLSVTGNEIGEIFKLSRLMGLSEQSSLFMPLLCISCKQRSVQTVKYGHVYKFMIFFKCVLC